MVHPDHYFKCEKLIGETWVVTGWAPDVKAAKSHAEAVGGCVGVSDKNGNRVASFEDAFELTENVLLAREIASDLIACSDKTCYDASLDLTE